MRTDDPDRLTDAEATSFRKLMRRVMDLKSLSYRDLADALADKDDKWSDEQSVRNRLKLGSRPILAPDAEAIWRTIAELESCRGYKWYAAAEQELLRALHPRPRWWEDYKTRQAGPGVHIPYTEIRTFAALIAAKVANTLKARKAAQRKIEALLTDQAPKMGIRWDRAALNYAGPIASAASRGEVTWKGPGGVNVIRQERGPSGNHDIQLVRETIALLVDLTNPRAMPSWRNEPPRK